MQQKSVNKNSCVSVEIEEAARKLSYRSIESLSSDLLLCS